MLKNLYKKGFAVMALLAASVCVTSCNDWIDVSSKAEVKYDDLFSYKNGFKDQLTGVYTSMCAVEMYGADLYFGIPDALGQLYYFWDGDDVGRYIALNRFKYQNSSAQSTIGSAWSHLYSAIANVNILLKGIEDHRGVLSPDEEKVIEGEALALRAFFHFDALRLFGKSMVAGADDAAIPYVKGVNTSVTPLSTVRETLDYVLADLSQAAALLKADPVVTGVSSTFLGDRAFHLNYYGVKALQARAYLYKGDKANALECAREVITSGRYPWVAPSAVATSTADTRDRLFLSECIFQLNNNNLRDISQRFLEDSQYNTAGDVLIMYWSTHDDLYEEVLYGYDYRNVYFTANIYSAYYYGCNKLYQLNNAYNNRQPMLRVSEMYLIAAECAASKNDRVDYLNDLLSHRGFPNDALIDPANVTDESLQDRIGKEYRKEFSYEGQWWYYCKRLDKESLPNQRTAFSKEYYVLPMPDVELEYGNRVTD